MTDEKNTFVRMNVKSTTKREIDIIAASEQRDIYEVVEDMLKLYKIVSVGKTPKSKNNKSVPVADVVAAH